MFKIQKYDMRFLDQLIEALEAPDLPEQDYWDTDDVYVNNPTIMHNVVTNFVTNNQEKFVTKFDSITKFSALFEAYLWSHMQKFSTKPNQATHRRWLQNQDLDLIAIMRRLSQLDPEMEYLIARLGEFLDNVPIHEITEALEAPELPDEEKWHDEEGWEPDFEIFAFFMKDEHEYSDYDVIDKFMKKFGDKVEVPEIDSGRTGDYIPRERTARRVYMYARAADQDYYRELLSDYHTMLDSGSWKGESVLNFEIDGITYSMDPIEHYDPYMPHPGRPGRPA